MCAPGRKGREGKRDKKSKHKVSSLKTSVSPDVRAHFAFRLHPFTSGAGIKGGPFAPLDCVNEEAVDSRGPGKTYVLHYLDSLYCFSLSLLAGNTQP